MNRAVDEPDQDKVFAFDQATEAFRQITAWDSFGKIVITV